MVLLVCARNVINYFLEHLKPQEKKKWQGVKTMKHITIYELLPLLRKGYVAMEENGIWYWFDHEPVPDNIGIWLLWSAGDLYELSAFNIAAFDGDWKDSLMKCGEKK